MQQSRADEKTGSSLTKVKPALRGVLHQHAIFAALAAGVLLIASATTPGAKLSCAIYTASLIALFTASAVYHRPTWSPASRALLRRIDHASIYVLIAGTYTPIARIGLGGTTGARLLQQVWVGAGAGIAQQLLWPGAPKILATAVYIALGWIMVPHVGEMGDALGSMGSNLVILGGVAYSIGGIIYALRWPDPSPKVFGYHEVFHALVIVAAIFHMSAIFLLVTAA